jgi:N-acetyltransferase
MLLEDVRHAVRQRDVADLVPLRRGEHETMLRHLHLVHDVSLGTVREGVFRRHRILRDGHHRDSVFYSLIREDWDSVRDGLAAQVGMDSGRR